MVSASQTASPNPDNQLFHANAAAEHYDIENASSIAPSDIDVVYHYKGYRDGGNSASSGGNRYRRSGSGSKSLGHRNHKRQNMRHANTPLARLSPSSELSHNTPRILTLGDLSGRPLPPGLLAEQSERSLNSPLSHLSSAAGSRHSHLHASNNRNGCRSLTCGGGPPTRPMRQTIAVKIQMPVIVNIVRRLAVSGS